MPKQSGDTKAKRKTAAPIEPTGPQGERFMEDTTQRTIKATIPIGSEELKIKVDLTASSSLNLSKQVELVTQLINCLASSQQMNLPFDGERVIIGATLRADEPKKRATTSSFGITYDCKGSDGFIKQSILWDLTQIGRKVDIIVRPAREKKKLEEKPTDETAKEKTQAAA